MSQENSDIPPTENVKPDCQKDSTCSPLESMVEKLMAETLDEFNRTVNCKPDCNPDCKPDCNPDCKPDCKPECASECASDKPECKSSGDCGINISNIVASILGQAFTSKPNSSTECANDKKCDADKKCDMSNMISSLLGGDKNNSSSIDMAAIASIVSAMLGNKSDNNSPSIEYECKRAIISLICEIAKCICKYLIEQSNQPTKLIEFVQPTRSPPPVEANAQVKVLHLIKFV